MGTTSTNLTVTIVTKVPDPGSEDLLLEAEIVASDNNDVTTYYVGTTYTLRLFKSTNISSLSIGNNLGTVSKSGSGLTTSVPYEGEDDEYIVFTGSETTSLDKVYSSNFIATLVGSVYDEFGEITTASLTPPTPGSKTVVANKKIYGVYKVTYDTTYDTYNFFSGVVGPMLIFFLGSSS